VGDLLPLDFAVEVKGGLGGVEATCDVFDLRGPDEDAAVEVGKELAVGDGLVAVEDELVVGDEKR
jgi:hypothetical protein